MRKGDALALVDEGACVCCSEELAKKKERKRFQQRRYENMTNRTPDYYEVGEVWSRCESGRIRTVCCVERNCWRMMLKSVNVNFEDFWHLLKRWRSVSTCSDVRYLRRSGISRVIRGISPRASTVFTGRRWPGAWGRGPTPNGVSRPR